MADPVDLARLVPDARSFLTELAQNNDREWFRSNKTRYDSGLKRPAEKLLTQVADWMAPLLGTAPSTKLFRPYRDVRFSEDKSPYHTHLHMMWSLPDGRAWMLGIAPDYATVGAGLMGFEPAQLDRWRAAVATDRGAELAQMVEQAAWRIEPPTLKRVPPPYPADHPQAVYLRHKGFVAWRDDLDAALSDDPVTTLQRVVEEFGPIMTWLRPVA